MVENQTGLYPEFIIHPGETLLEVLEDKGITQRELACKTGVSAAYVSKIIRGTKSISTAFARKLEYTLGIDTQFWINLQANYEKQLYEYQEMSKISEEEKNIVDHDLKEFAAYFEAIGILKKGLNTVTKVIEMRKILQVSDLTFIPNIKAVGAYRHATNVEINPYVMYAWRRLCELKSEETLVTEPLNTERLKSSLYAIKELMFIEDVNMMVSALTTIFSKCGIIFNIVKNFPKAPVQGYIKKNSNGSIILCMTIRQAYADIFWFTLFHEVAHIINGDYDNTMVDYEDNAKSPKEIAANNFASSILISDEDYAEFVNEGDFSINSIRKFSSSNKIQPYILIGRLQKQGHIPYSIYSNYKVRYKWAND